MTTLVNIPGVAIGCQRTVQRASGPHTYNECIWLARRETIERRLDLLDILDRRNEDADLRRVDTLRFSTSLGFLSQQPVQTTATVPLVRRLHGTLPQPVRTPDELSQDLGRC